MKSMQGQKGFTLIEILLVVTIMGFLLAVILPRAFRTSTDAKYSIVRQNCTELAGYANQWVEEQILAQDTDSTATVTSYYRTLADPDGSVPATKRAAWIADISASNWNEHASNFGVSGRNMNGVADSRPETSVEGMIEPAMIPRNPFNGTNVFLSTNEVSNRVIPGAIACSYGNDSSSGANFDYFALIFQGTDSTGFDRDPTAPGVDFHAGMNDTRLEGLRNGVFMAKLRSL